jgi:hypothetical protein
MTADTARKSAGVSRGERGSVWPVGVDLVAQCVASSRDGAGCTVGSPALAGAYTPTLIESLALEIQSPEGDMHLGRPMARGRTALFERSGCDCQGVDDATIFSTLNVPRQSALGRSLDCRLEIRIGPEGPGEGDDKGSRPAPVLCIIDGDPGLRRAVARSCPTVAVQRWATRSGFIRSMAGRITTRRVPDSGLAPQGAMSSRRAFNRAPPSSLAMYRIRGRLAIPKCFAIAVGPQAMARQM